MIISASRRTDIPACYPDWFFNRLAAGFVDVRNPMNPRQVSRVRLGNDRVDGFVFWTKNPLPMMARLDALDGYAYCFLFTLTAYGEDIEPGVPDKDRVLVPAFRRLAERIGPERVIWRYDPILVSARYPPDFHRARFLSLARQLAGSTSMCIISFIDFYRDTARRLQSAGLTAFPDELKRELAGDLAATARECGMRMAACAEPLDLRPFGIEPAHCIDARLFEQWLGGPLHRVSGTPLRPDCGCLPSIDIGQYDTCPLGCRYCYARRGKSPAPVDRHDPNSSLLFGQLGPADIVRERAMPLLRK